MKRLFFVLAFLVTLPVQAQQQAERSYEGFEVRDRTGGRTVLSALTKNGLILNPITTAQRDALSPSEGWLIYNSTMSRYEQYDGSEWVPFVGAGGASTADAVSYGLNVGGVNRATVEDAIIALEAGKVNDFGQTANRGLFTDASGNVVVGLIPNTAIAALDYSKLLNPPTIPPNVTQANTGLVHATNLPLDVFLQSEIVGTPDGTKYLRDDLQWVAVPAGGGDMAKLTYDTDDNDKIDADKIEPIAIAGVTTLQNVLDGKMALATYDGDGNGEVDDGAIPGPISRDAERIAAIAAVKTLPANPDAAATVLPTVGDEDFLTTLTLAGDQVVELPTDATANFPLGTPLTFMHDANSGSKTFAAESGATRHGTFTLAARGDVAQFIKLAANTWYALGIPVSGGSSVNLETDVLAGTNITITDHGDGTITINSTASGTATMTEVDLTNGPAVIAMSPDELYKDAGSEDLVYKDSRDDQVRNITTGLVAGIDTVAATISNYAVTNPSDRNVVATFNSTEQLGVISIEVTGAETATLSVADCVESGAGPYTYDCTHAGTAYGTYTLTLVVAEDAAANDGAGSESDGVEVVEVLDPPIVAFTATLSGADTDFEITSDQQLAAITVDGISAEHVDQQFDELDFTESGAGPWTYTATQAGTGEGAWRYTLAQAENSGGVDGSANERQYVWVDAVDNAHDLTNMVAYYSLASMPGYVGDVAEVTRASDLTTDLFTTAEIDAGGLTSWCAGECRVTTLINQVNPGTNDRTAAYAHAMEVVTSGGVLHTRNGLPTMDDATNDRYMIGGPTMLMFDNAWLLGFESQQESGNRVVLLRGAADQTRPYSITLWDDTGYRFSIGALGNSTTVAVGDLDTAAYVIGARTASGTQHHVHNGDYKFRTALTYGSTVNNTVRLKDSSNSAGGEFLFLIQYDTTLPVGYEDTMRAEKTKWGL